MFKWKDLFFITRPQVSALPLPIKKAYGNENTWKMCTHALMKFFETLHEKNDELLLVFKANAAQDDLLLKKKKETAIKKFIRSRLKKQEVQSVALLNNAEYIIACKTNDVKEKLLLQ